MNDLVAPSPLAARGETCIDRTETLATDSAACRACEGPTEDFDLCEGCAELVTVEIARVLGILGPLGAVGTTAQVEDTKRSLSVLYASMFLGTDADKVACFLGVSRTASRQYAMRFRAAQIWSDGQARGPWASKPWLSPAFCRLFLMDALVGAGLAVRGKNRWEFIHHDGPTREAA